MPKGVKIQKIAMGKHSKEDMDLMKQMFDQMTGMTNADIEVILPKYIKLRTHLGNFIKIYNILIGHKALHETFPEFKEEFDEITNFINSIKEECGDPSTEESQEKYANLTQDEINKVYKELKEKPCLKSIITTAGRLSRHSKYLSKNDNNPDSESKYLTDGFIKKEPGLSLYLLSFSNLDFKEFWASQKATKEIKKFIITILSHTYETSFFIYDIVTSPDIDIRKFSSVLITNLDGLRKQIPRCDDAFNIIVKSVKLLEGNFKSYYKNSIEAENPSLILENFVIDVSAQQQSTGIRVTQQFKKIIMHMRKAASNNKDPKVKRLFNMLNTQMKAMEEQTTNVPVSKTQNQTSSEDVKSQMNDDPIEDIPFEEDLEEKNISNIEEPEEVPPLIIISSEEQHEMPGNCQIEEI
jgi:hypothetical protein